jgi:hypothetical protein
MFRLYRTLGLTTHSRKLHMRDNILSNAERLHKEGLDSRVPFLKKEFGQDVPDGTTAKKEHGVPIAEYRGGDVVADFDLNAVLRFNTFNAPSGLQLVPFYSDRHRKTVLKVVQCTVEMAGDLKIARLHERVSYGPNPPQNGYFHALLYEVFLQTKIDPAQRIAGIADEVQFSFLTGNLLSHEKEHAFHYTLAYLSNLELPVWRGEHMSMLSDFIRGNAPEILAPSGPIANHQAPHALASLYFLARLHCRYGISPFQVKMAISGYNNEQFSQLGDPAGRPHLEKIREYGLKEYHRAYRKVFGLEMDEIKEIIVGLPTV